jgi:hypothetical protein
LQVSHGARLFTLMIFSPDPLRPGVLLSVNGAASANSRDTQRAKTCSALD